MNLLEKARPVIPSLEIQCWSLELSVASGQVTGYIISLLQLLLVIPSPHCTHASGDGKSSDKMDKNAWMLD